MPAAVPHRRTAAAGLGLVALGAVSLLPWWQQWTAPAGVRGEVDGWNVWQASHLAASAVVLAAMALFAAARFPAAGDSLRRFVPATAAWVAVLLLVLQWHRITSPPSQPTGVTSLADVQGVQYVRAETPEYLKLVPEAPRPVLHLLADGSSYRQLGYGAFLGAALVVIVAVLLTRRALRHRAAG